MDRVPDDPAPAPSPPPPPSEEPPAVPMESDTAWTDEVFKSAILDVETRDEE